MASYLEKCFELYSSGKNIKQIIENIYINYASIDNNDKIYEYKKIISQEFDISLKDIKLIGSSHTLFSIKDGTKEKTSSNDYDFAIINTSLFNKYWSKIMLNDKEPKKTFFNYLILGKIHPYYLAHDGIVYKEIKNKLKKLDADKSATICIYMCEEFFIKNLCDYLESDLIKYFNRLKNDVPSTGTLIVKELNKIR